MINKDFKRGARAAADVLDSAGFNATTTHPYRLDDVVLFKLNLSRRAKPRRNKQALQDPKKAWIVGFAVALAEMCRQYIHGGDGPSVCAVASAAGLTLAKFKAAGVDPIDLRALRKAGVPRE